jgi:16S rRNA (cytidine1402-2'-O)-methyltransferase
MLVLVATPIGNLADITLRALEILKSVDLILCEDTRHSFPLLNHYGIHKPLESYHAFNEKQKIQKLLERLESGQNIALISDAGSPLISDPGFPLVQACVERNIPVTAAPGPCSIIYALSCSGFSPEKFQFLGFFPKEESPLYERLDEIAAYDGISICFEAARRLPQTFTCMAAIYPHLEACAALELTKAHERFLRGTVEELVLKIADDSLKGECILLFKGKRNTAQSLPKHLKEDAELLMSHFKIPLKEALKAVAQIKGVRRRDLYQQIAVKH